MNAARILSIPTSSRQTTRNGVQVEGRPAVGCVDAYSGGGGEPRGGGPSSGFRQTTSGPSMGAPISRAFKKGAHPTLQHLLPKKRGKTQRRRFQSGRREHPRRPSPACSRVGSVPDPEFEARQNQSRQTPRFVASLTRLVGESSDEFLNSHPQVNRPDPGRKRSRPSTLLRARGVPGSGCGVNRCWRAPPLAGQTG